MRYTENQLFISGLVGELGLHPEKFNYPAQLMYLRGRHLTRDSASTPCATCGASAGALPYEIAPHHLESCPFGAESEQLVKRAIRDALLALDLSDLSSSDREQILQELTQLHSNGFEMKRSILSARHWKLLKQYAVLGGTQLCEIGFWNLLLRYLKGETFSLVHDALGYESIITNWNAAEAIPWFLSDIGVNYTTIKEGMSEIPKKLVKEALDTNLVALDKEFELTEVEEIAAGNERLFKLSFLDGKNQKTVLRVARHVILAMPKGALQHIEIKIPPIERSRSREDLNRFLRDLQSVKAHRLFKLFLGFESPWWDDSNALGHASGKAITDLPVRQVYFYEAAWLMASYSDGRYAEFWQTLLEGNDSFFCRKTLEPDEQLIVDLYGAPKALVEEAHRQLTWLHPRLAQIPEPVMALVRNWSAAPYYGGWHTWNAHTKPWEVMKNLSRPIKDVNLYTCGEAFSGEQGWVEGALKSAEMVMAQLRLDPPDWIREADYSKLRCDGYKEYIEN